MHNENELHVSIDIETLDKQAGCVILQIGACTFRPYQDKIIDEFSVNIEIYHQITKYKSTVSQSTIEFWDSQRSDVHDHVFRGKRVLAPEALSLLSHAFPWNNIEGIWGNGSDFDIGILNEAYARIGQDTPPWHFRTSRCMRTIKSLVPSSVYSGFIQSERTKHIGVEDAKHQAKIISAILQHIKTTLRDSVNEV